MPRFAAFALPLTLIAAPAVAQDLTPAETAKVDAIVADTLAKTGVPSASIGPRGHGDLGFGTRGRL